jgi:hypothetical protein
MKKEKKEAIEKMASFKFFRIGFYIYLFILNIIWLLICLPYSLFTWEWQYSAEKFSVKVFALHFDAALKRKNAKIKEYEPNQTS